MRSRLFALITLDLTSFHFHGQILTLLKVHDAVEEDISSHFERIAAFIDEARNVEANVLGSLSFPTLRNFVSS